MGQTKGANKLEYSAFLSYSHSDTRTATKVHRRLETYRIDKALVGRQGDFGPVPSKLGPIFRDRNDFDAGALLRDQTISAIDSSFCLIVLASPHSAQSKYVDEEVRIFRSRHPNRPIIPLIIGGRPEGGEQECFPLSLRFVIDTQGQVTTERYTTLAADLQESGDGEELALAKIVARIIGLPPNDVFRRSERLRKSRLRMWVAGLSLTTALVSGLAIFAEIKREEAKAAQIEAENQRDAADMFKDRANTETGRAVTSIKKIIALSNSMIFAIVEKIRGNQDHQEEIDIDIAKTILTFQSKIPTDDIDDVLLLKDTAIGIEAAAKLIADSGDQRNKLEYLDKSREIWSRLLEQRPDDQELASGLAGTFDMRGDAKLRSNDQNGAISEYIQSVRILDKINSKTREIYQHLIFTKARLGVAQWVAQDRKNAEITLQSAAKIYCEIKIKNSDPDMPENLNSMWLQVKKISGFDFNCQK